MTFPTIPTTGNGRLISAVQADTTATRTFPNLSGLTKNSGDLLIAVVFAYQSSATANAVWSGWTAGWTEFADFSTTTGMAIGAAYKFSTGAETGTIAVTQAATITGQATMLVMSIPGAHASTPPEAGSFASGTTAAADPAAFDPAGWAAEETLWVACSASGEDATAGAFTGNGSAPASYTNYAETGISADVVGGVGGAVAFRQLFAASENVGAFAVDTSNARNSALVIAVRPSATSAITLADSGAGSDLLQLPPTPITLADSGAAADSLTAGQAAAVPVHDNHVLVAVAGARTNLSFTAPTGSGTLLIVQIDKETTAAITPPTGFTQKSSVATSAPSQHAVFYGWTADTGGGPYNFTWTGSTFAGGSIHRISDAVGTGDPFDAFDHEFQNASTGGVSPAVTLTTTGPNRLLFFGAIGINGSSTWTPPSGFTEIYESINLTAARLDDPTQGGTGSLTATFGTETGQMAAFLGAVLPAATEGPTDKTLTDAATQTDLVAVAAQAPLGEVGAGADLLSPVAQVALADAGTGSDGLSVTQGVTPKTLTDAGLGSDALAVRQPTWLVDTFQQFGTAESWADATTHGQWFVQFGGVAAGNGVGTETDGSTVLFEKPDIATDPDPGDETHAGLVTSTAQFGANLDLAADVKTVVQLRQNLAPNPWEVAWLVWAYTDNNHFYYFALKPNGIELGKRHPAYAGGQRFLWTAATPTLTLNTWNRIRVVQDANVLSVFVDGTELTLGTGGPNGKSFVDVGGAQADAPYLTGSVGLYNEDAWVRFDNVQANAAVPADSGLAADTAQVAAQILLVDSGAAAETLRPVAQVPLADTGVAAESLTVNQGIPKTLADSGTGADTVRVAVATTAADSGAGADQAAVAAALALADAGAGADSLSSGTVAATVEIGAVRWITAPVGTPKTLTDSGAGADTLRAAAAVPLSEAGAGTDTLRPAATISLLDSGTTADSLTVGQFEPKTLADSGTAADTLRVTAAALLTDSGIAADLLQPAAAVLLADNGTAADSIQVNQGIPKPLADSGTASDQPQVAAQTPLPESGQATDTLVADQTRTLTDSATAADSLTVGQFVPKPLNDAAASADQLLAAAQAPLGDSGTAAETLLPVTTAPLTDAGTAADALVVQQAGDTKTLTDSGTGSDILAVAQARLLADNGAGSDQLVVIQGRVLTDTGTGSDTLRPSALLVLADGATAGDLLALAALVSLRDSGTGQDALVVLTVARWIRTQSTERPTTTVSREPATATASREPALATSSREQGGP